MAIARGISKRRWIGLSLLVLSALGLLALPGVLSFGSECEPNDCWYCTPGLFTAEYCWPIFGDDTGWCFCDEGYEAGRGFYCDVYGQFCGSIWVQ